MSNLKGCLGFLLALDLTENIPIGVALNTIEDLQQLVYMVLVFSLVVQGAILTPTFKCFDLTENGVKKSLNNDQKDKEKEYPNLMIGANTEENNNNNEN